MALSSTLTAKIKATLTSALDLATVEVPLSYTKQLTLTSGTGANQADLVFHDTRTLTASTAEDLDLAGGLTDALGNSLTFVRIKALIVAADSSNGDVIQVGGDATSAFVTWVADATDIVQVRPGGVLALFAPDATAYAVTASTGDLLQITNADSGASASYDIVIIGASA